MLGQFARGMGRGFMVVATRLNYHKLLLFSGVGLAPGLAVASRVRGGLRINNYDLAACNGMKDCNTI